MDDDTQMVPVEDLQFDKRTESLPAEFIDRITLIHHVFRDYLSVTLEQTIDNFKYDQNPESEIAIWEHMASVMLTLQYRLNWRPEKLAPAVKVVLGISMGEIQDSTLDPDSTNQIIAIWNQRDPQ